MKIHELFDRDPRHSALANTGQARIVDKPDEQSLRELKAELETFVCDGQYGEAIERVLRGYLGHVDKSSQVAAWISGFFGSGKSHLLKMLAHLWVDTPFADGTTARSLVRELPADVNAALREIDTLARRAKLPLVAAAGTLPSLDPESVRRSVLTIVLRARGLPEKYHQAQFHFWLRERGFLEPVQRAVAAAGKDWQKELANLYVSPHIAKALLACDPNFAPDEKQARQVLREQFRDRTEDITTAEFLEGMRNALLENGQWPFTILVLDEAQQYLGNNDTRATILVEVAEAIAKQCGSRVLLVASGQSALTSTPLLQKLMGRFRVTALLSDTDVEAVTRKVLLQKKPTGLAAVTAVLDKHAGEVSKHLLGSRLQERSDDGRTRDQDYPLLPTRRRFWEEAFRAVDKAGTNSQLRSQLRILHDALRAIADRDVGAVITADALFDALAADLANSGVLPNELNNRIRGLNDGTERGRLRQRLAGLVFLIQRMRAGQAADTGVRATNRMLADLLVDDVAADSGPLRQRIDQALHELLADSTLMQIGDEYVLQTSEGAEWERALREKRGELSRRDADLFRLQQQAIGAAVQEVVGAIRLRHGQAKVARQLVLHADADEEPRPSDAVVVWLRDGKSRKDADDTARRLGATSPVLHLHLEPRNEDLRNRVLDFEAARLVIAEKGAPSTVEGQQARDAMLSRQRSAEQAKNHLVHELLAAARVVQGGGTEVFGESLTDKLQKGAEASLTRLFPRFHEADFDHRGWEAAVEHARTGSDRPFRLVQWERAIEEHPVAREVQNLLANARRGTDVQKELKGPPFGWPQDAIDAALLGLHRSGTIRAVLNGQPAIPGQLDQAKLKSAEFRLEKVKLGTEEKLALRGLFQKLSIPCKNGEEEMKAIAFLAAFEALQRGAGGEAPLPPPPDGKLSARLKEQTGSAQLAAMHAAIGELGAAITAAQEQQKRAQQRLPQWELLTDLLAQAAGLPVAADIAPEVAAIRAQRSLLGDPDPVPPLLAKVATALRAALTDAQRIAVEQHRRADETLAADANWTALGDADRQALRHQRGLAVPMPPSTKTDADLLAELHRQSLPARADATSAVPEKVRQVLEDAAKKRQPKARRVALRTATLTTADEVRAWIDEQQGRLLGEVQQGPVIVG